ncbi:tRNA (N6-threonylcarbamoyladenosine(37)-N6)-methyltransferase TrmO [Aidingimonas halophila]|uniref:tRNA-Thr(GGU) m(6)t(6)A37 methyltransferase TsaA n=1 Tax=Aidingimonas halophila TaxID=574349 RepID=A0A1H2US28_9GAMM|nr:tRNA (N6-threonylcarbamoyladenosine(37)-N6)-methyltransferase TrmO [Aidingimonas halophila]GHC23021.1 tRNA (N6-threonylcarbamoyladenosine(37)-N6)-methyltransferase TrmO [Aidingimonas halophila]SDW58364.1 tRNA-Thr(GGU) m(6)t(6)A37 methyltransferase TsaA [Aidingimonas halophila]
MTHSDAPYSATTFAVDPIGRIESDYPDKFGIPRQPGLAKAARATLVMLPPYDDPLTIRGLDAFSHLWVTFIFHRSPSRWTPLIRPPRLGGNTRVGVFASRSTHRPNRLGLSLVELVAVDTSQGVRLQIQGHDLVNGTPVVDIKPHLPWADTPDSNQAGYAEEPPDTYPVRFAPQAERFLDSRRDGNSLRELVVQVLAQDPRPAYRKGAEQRTYGVRLRDVDVRFQARLTEAGAMLLYVTELVAGSS